MPLISRQPSAVEECARQLREMIADGTLAAGQPLRQDELAAQLGISRTPVREAIARLQAEGLAVVERHRGATVFKPSPDELKQIYEIRMLLEPYAAKIAVKMVNEDVLAKLRGLYDEMQDSPPWVFDKLNREFHLTLYETAQHNELYELIKALRYRSDPYIRILIGGGGGEVAQRGHDALINAVADGDEEAARIITYEHLAQTLATVSSIIDHRHADRVRALSDQRSDR
jgi:DNA-binding GntR family transcriptional regulator